MKKRKLLTLVAILGLSLILFISHASSFGFNKCASDQDCPGAMRCLLNPDGFLVCREPAPDEVEGGNPQTYSECLSAGGNWNMATRCTKTGFYENVRCTISGEVSVFGVVLKGAYTPGGRYSIPWSEYSCFESTGNCCTKQGLYSGTKKLA